MWNCNVIFYYILSVELQFGITISRMELLKNYFPEIVAALLDEFLVDKNLELEDTWSRYNPNYECQVLGKSPQSHVENFIFLLRNFALISW